LPQALRRAPTSSSRASTPVFGSLRLMAMLDGSIRHVPQSMLAVSEPNPAWFGNPPNAKGEASWSNKNWLKSRFHFSFAEYSNPKNQNFGVLRVMNDDLVQPHRGFGTHGHRDAEICTYVVEGELTHQDSMGTTETLTGGAIQFMTAGSGVQHSEHNLGDRPLRFIQMWLSPRTRGLAPNYGSSPGDASARQNAWHHMVSDTVDEDSETPVKINTDANMFVTELTEGRALDFDVRSGRQAYLLCVDGNTTIDAVASIRGRDGVGLGVELAKHDSAEIVGPVSFSVVGPAHLLLVEMAFDRRAAGRGDLR